MAKKQSFSDKTSGKNANTKNKVKLIRSSMSSKTNSIRFLKRWLLSQMGNQLNQF